MTVSQIFAQNPEERRDFMREVGEPTHYGRPRLFSRPSFRTPTHRGEPRGR